MNKGNIKLFVIDKRGAETEGYYKYRWRSLLTGAKGRWTMDIDLAKEEAQEHVEAVVSTMNSFFGRDFEDKTYDEIVENFGIEDLGIVTENKRGEA